MKPNLLTKKMLHSEHHGSHGYNMQRYGCTLCIEDDMVPRDQCFRADRAEELRNHLERIHKIILLKTPGRQRHKYEDIQKHVATKMQDSEAFRIDMIVCSSMTLRLFA